jgi:hypothetical protein
MDPLGQLNAIGLVRGKAQLPDPLPLAVPQSWYDASKTSVCLATSGPLSQSS